MCSISFIPHTHPSSIPLVLCPAPPTSQINNPHHPHHHHRDGTQSTVLRLPHLQKLLSHQRNIAFFLASIFGTHCRVRFYIAVANRTGRGRSHSERHQTTLRGYLRVSDVDAGVLLDNLLSYDVVYNPSTRLACYAGFYIELDQTTFDFHQDYIQEHISEVSRRGRLPHISPDQWDFEGRPFPPSLLD